MPRKLRQSSLSEAFFFGASPFLVVSSRVFAPPPPLPSVLVAKADSGVKDNDNKDIAIVRITFFNILLY